MASNDLLNQDLVQVEDPLASPSPVGSSWEPVETPLGPKADGDSTVKWDSFNSSVRESFYHPATPDDMGEVLQLAEKAKVKPQTVYDNLAEFRRMSQLPDFDRFLAEAPDASDMAARDKWFAKMVVEDDHVQAQKYEQLSAKMRTEREAEVRDEERRTGQQKRNIEAREARDNGLRPDLPAILPEVMRPLWDKIVDSDYAMEFASGQAMTQAGLLADKAADLAASGQDLTPEQWEVLNKLEAVSGYDSTSSGLTYGGASASEMIGQQFQSLTSNEKNPLQMGLATGIAVGTASALTTGPFAPVVAPVTAGAGVASGTAAGIYQQSRSVERGMAFLEFRKLKHGDGTDVTPQEAAFAATVVGDINGLMEVVGVGTAIKLVPGARKLLKGGMRSLLASSPTARAALFDFARTAAVGWSGEVTTEVLQEVSNIVASGVLEDKSLASTLADPQTMDQLTEIFKKVGSGMAVMGVLGGSVNLATDLNYVRKVKNAEKTTQRLIDTFTEGAKLRLADRSVETFAEYTQNVATRGGVGDIYLQADRVLETLQEKGMEAEEINAWLQSYGIDPSELSVAPTGGDLVFKAGQVAKGMKQDSATFSALLDDMRVDASAHSLRDVREGVQNEAQTQTYISELYQQDQEQRISSDDVDMLVGKITEQAIAAGLSPVNAEKNVRLLAARANALQCLTGAPAAEHLQRWGLNVRKMKYQQFLDDKDPFSDVVYARQNAVAIAQDIENNIIASDKMVVDGNAVNATVSANSETGKWYMDKGFQSREVATALRKFAKHETLTDKQQAVIDAYQEWMADQKAQYAETSDVEVPFQMYQNNLQLDKNGVGLNQKLPFTATFDPKQVSTEKLPQSLAGEKPVAGGGRYFHSTAEELQAWLDKNGDGFLYRVTVPMGVTDRLDHGDPDYKHKFTTFSAKVFSYTTNLEDAKKIGLERPGSIVYRILPEDLADEYTVQVHDAKKGVLHVQSPNAADIGLADVIYREARPDEYVPSVEESRRIIGEQRLDGDRAQRTSLRYGQRDGQGGVTPLLQSAQRATTPFKEWSNNAPYVPSSEALSHEFKSGEKVVVEAYHGTARPDRVGTKFLKKRATSGPMSFFTSDPELASGYATGKSDTSLNEENIDYENWFKFKPKGARSYVDISRAWYFLDGETKNKISERLGDIRTDDEGNIIYEEGGGGIGSYQWELQQTQRGYDKRGNPLKAAVETWLNSGALFNSEEDFMTVLELAGFPVNDLKFDHPHATMPAVYKTYVAMQSPLVTNNIPQEVIDTLNAAAKKDRSRAKLGGADPWDKNNRTLKAWVEEFNSEDRDHVWTSIPDKVTQIFQSFGYDGIVDMGGKNGGEKHKVYIPFTETQIKSAIGNKGTFSPYSNDILKQDGPIPRAAIIPGDQQNTILLFEKANLSSLLHEIGHLFLDDLRYVSANYNVQQKEWDAVKTWWKSNAAQIAAEANKVGVSRGLWQSAWHGSPHKFDKFSTAKMGTGEGAQAYGAGLYFAESKEVAKYYRDQLSNHDLLTVRIGGKVIQGDAISDVGIEAIKLLERGAKQAGQFPHNTAYYAKKMTTDAEVLAQIEEWKDAKIGWEKNKGRLYKVELAPAEDEYLLWDRPLSEQSEKVKAAIEAGKGYPSSIPGKMTQPEPHAAISSMIKRRENWPGVDIYRAIERQTGSDKAASEYLHSLGIRGVKYLDGSSRNAGEGNFNYVIFSDDDVAITEMFQAQGGGFAEGIQSVTPEDVTAWIDSGTTGDKAKDEAIRIATHEQFARGFEQYLREGTAPSIELRGAFRAFKNWLTKIYANISQLDVKISPEMKDVFDRLLATEQEIKQARSQAGMIALLDETFLRENKATPEDVAEYRRATGQPEDVAREKQDNHENVGRDDLRKRMTEKATKEVDALPSYKAVHKLTRDNDGKYGAGAGISRASIIEAYGEAAAAKLPANPALWRKDGYTLEEAALVTGYGSPQELLTALQTMKPREQAIEERTEALMIEHDDAFETEEAIRSAQQLKQYEIESKWLEKKAAVGKRALTRQAIRAWAEATTAGQKMVDAIGVHKLLANSKKLREKAIASAKAGKWDAAFDANERLRLNEALIAEHYRVKDDYRKAQKRWKSALTANTKESYRNQINQLLSRYQMVTSLSPYAADTKPLTEFMASLQATVDDLDMSSVPSFPDWILSGKEGKAHEMTWAEVQELDNAIKFLVGRGREEMQQLLSDEQTTVAALAMETVRDSQKVKTRAKFKNYGTVQKSLRYIQDKWRGYFASLDILLWQMRTMDSFVHLKDKVGNNEGKLFNPIIEGWNKRRILMETIQRSMQPKIDVLLEGMKNAPHVYTHVPTPKIMLDDSRGWTHETIIAAALNMGNEENFSRLIEGYGLTPEQAFELTSVLSAEEWQAIQGIWDDVNSLWPEINQVHQKINHFTMKKIEAGQITVKAKDGSLVTLKGGYYPASYDSARAEQWSEADSILASQEAINQTPRASSKFTKERSKTGGGMPLKLSLSVLGQHISDTASYITLAEAVRDTDRVTRSPVYATRAKEVLGDEGYKQIRLSLKHVIRPDISARTDMDRSIQWLTSRTSSFYLAYNMSTALVNLVGVFPTVKESGLKALPIGLIKGFSAFGGNPLAAKKHIMELSSYMRQRDTDRDADITRKLMKFKPESKAVVTLEKAQDYGYSFIKAADDSYIIPIWLGVYEASMKETGNQDKAIAKADAIIRSTSPSGAPIDQPGILRAYGVARLFAPFFTWAGNAGGRFRYHFRALESGQINSREYTYHIIMEWLAPALAGASMMAFLRTGDPPEPEKLAFEVVTYPLQGFPIMRDLVSVGIGRTPTAVRMPQFDILNSVGEIARSGGKVTADLYDGGDSEKNLNKLLHAGAVTASFAIKLPMSKIYDKMVRGIEQAEREDNPALYIFPDMSKKR